MSVHSAQIYFAEAQRFRENGLLEKAVCSYNKAIEIDPHFISAYYTLALLYHQTHQFENAVIHLKKSRRIGPP